jgi:hypothetical protein
VQESVPNFGALDLAITLGMDPLSMQAPSAVAEPSRRRVAADAPGDEARSYAISDGAIFDISYCAGVHLVDTKTNAELYGRGISAAQILEGATEIPIELARLYATIGQVSARAGWRECAAGAAALAFASARSPLEHCSSMPFCAAAGGVLGRCQGHGLGVWDCQGADQGGVPGLVLRGVRQTARLRLCRLQRHATI